MTSRAVDRLYIQEVVDERSRDNFIRIQQFFREDPFYKGQFKFFEFTVAAAGSFDFVHSLGFQPLDVITTSVRNSDGTVVTWDYDDFTSSIVRVTTDGAATIRAFIGRYAEGGING